MNLNAEPTRNENFKKIEYIGLLLFITQGRITRDSSVIA